MAKYLAADPVVVTMYPIVGPGYDLQIVWIVRGAVRPSKRFKILSLVVVPKNAFIVRNDLRPMLRGVI
jgi:hypothetical protein